MYTLLVRIAAETREELEAILAEEAPAVLKGMRPFPMRPPGEGTEENEEASSALGQEITRAGRIVGRLQINARAADFEPDFCKPFWRIETS